MAISTIINAFAVSDQRKSICIRIASAIIAVKCTSGRSYYLVSVSRELLIVDLVDR